jgi:thiamine kinase
VTDLLSAAGAIARIPGVEPAKASYRALGAGLSHRLWFVQQEERKLVLRLDTPHAGALGLDRKTELAILRQAGKAGIAPEVVFADMDAGMLVYDYLPGRSWTAADLEDTSKLEALAALLQKVHALPRSGVAFDAAGAAERYVGILRDHADFGDFALRCRDVVVGIPRAAASVCCHNDIVAANVVATPDLRLLDWEYACDNEPLFDLASLIGYHDLGEAQAQNLLCAYAGKDDAAERERLSLQLRLFDALQWLWFAVREVAMPREGQRERLAQLARRIDSSA